jgi:hypothetical protein
LESVQLFPSPPPVQFTLASSVRSSSRSTVNRNVRRAE